MAEKSINFPFCSKRCRLVDLGKWFREDYRILRPAFPTSEGLEDESFVKDGEGE